MCPGAREELRRLIRTALDALESGDWRSVLDPPGLATRNVAGPAELVRAGLGSEMAARAMQLMAQGFVSEGLVQVRKAATQLPRHLRRTTGMPGQAVAELAREPRDRASDEHLVWRMALLLWREHYELVDLQRRLDHGRLTPREELVEAYIEFLCRVEFDPRAWYRRRRGAVRWNDGTTVECTRTVMLARATELRRFVDPRAGDLSQSVWRDVGSLRGLRAEALGVLAQRATAAPWWGIEGTAGLEVSRGRLRAWEYARQWYADLEPWNHVV
jgi:hypothetical protein